MVRLSAIVLLSTLAGCAWTDPKVVYQPFEVKVAVEVPCAAQSPPEPEWATKGMPRVDPVTGQNLDVAVDKLTAERHQRLGYEDQLKAAVRGCQ